MGASLTQPIFHGGQLLAERRAAKLMYEASIEQYKQAVLSAFQDVADTLARLEAGSQALAAAESSRRSAEQSYRNTASRVRLGALAPYAGRASEQRFISARLAEVHGTPRAGWETRPLFQAMGRRAQPRRPKAAAPPRSPEPDPGTRLPWRGAFVHDDSSAAIRWTTPRFDTAGSSIA